MQNTNGNNTNDFDIYKLKEDITKQKVLKHEKDITDWHNLPDKLIEDLKDKSQDCAEELLAGLIAVKKYPKTVTFFGSARTKPLTKYYEDARTLAGKLCKHGYTIVTGGGPGIMEAANKGSFENCNIAVGFNITLPKEQVINSYVTHGVDFHFFSSRKMALIFSGEAYIFYPGGFGTLDEFFQVLTLIQTKKMPKVPVFAVGSDFWKPLDDFIRFQLLENFNTISDGDEHLYKITDSHDEIMEDIMNSSIQDDSEFYK